MSWITVCEFRNLAAGMPVAVMVDGDAICVVRAGADVFAVHDECTHAAVPLSEGEVDGATIECWMHGSKFDLRTGACRHDRSLTLRRYRAHVIDGDVWIELV